MAIFRGASAAAGVLLLTGLWLGLVQYSSTCMVQRTEPSSFPNVVPRGDVAVAGKEIIAGGGGNYNAIQAANSIDNSQLRVNLESKDLATRTTSRTGVQALWVLQDLKRKLVGSGAHRTLTSVVTLSASSAAVQRVSKICQLKLVERLPSGVFADQFELQGIQRRGGVPARGFISSMRFEKAWIHGDVNLEQPAFLSTQSTVDVCVTLHKVASDGNNGSSSLLQAGVALPLHARYPPLSVDSHSVVHIPMPYMLVSCQDVGEDGTAVPGTDEWKQEVSLENVTELETFPRVLDWMVPAGNPADYSFVARFTAIAALSGVLVVFAASVAADEQRR